MKNLLKTALLTAVTTMALAGCNKPDSNNGDDLRPLNVGNDTIAGAWQMESMSLNGQLDPNKIPDTYQFEITSSRIYIIKSRNGNYLSRSASTYTLTNGRITVPTSRRAEIPSLDVLLVTPSTMQLRPVNQGNNRIYTWNLRRIDPAQVVGGAIGGGNGSAPLKEESIVMDVKTPSLQFTKTYTKVSNSDNKSDNFVDLSCRYSKGTFSLDLTSYRKRNNPRAQSRETETQLSLSGAVRMDLGRYEEAQSFSVERNRGDQRPGFTAQVSTGRSRDIYFSLGARTGRCEVSLNRAGEVVTFIGECRGVEAHAERLESGARVNIRGTCLLN